MNASERYTITIELPQGVALARIFGALRFDGYSVRCTGPTQYVVDAPRPVRDPVRPLRPTSPEAA